MHALTMVPLRDESAPEEFFRAAASLLRAQVPWEDILWRTATGAQDLFAPENAGGAAPSTGAWPAAWADWFGTALLHKDPARYGLVYRLLHRMACAPRLLEIATDADVCALRALEKSVRRDMHKMRAFLRFRRFADEDGSERYAAWFEPEHHIVSANADFFIRRFSNMHWSIVTPEKSLHWDGAALLTGPGGRKADVPAEDAVDAAWRAYFAATFNPARVNPRAMLKEMPRKYWKNMPETHLVAPLVRSAQERTRAMVAAAPTIMRKSAPMEAAMPAAEHNAMDALRAAIQDCTRCPLYRDATQAVCGEGPRHAGIMVVAEQPGDNEDLTGRPLVGPAGKVFDEALKRVELERQTLFVTNAVKHFKFTPRGKRRIHAKPNVGEIEACRWWLQQEIAAVKPKLIVAMGASAVRSLTGRSLPVTALRGQIQPLANGLPMLVTTHPSYLLRLTDPDDKRAAWSAFLDDWKLAASSI